MKHAAAISLLLAVIATACVGSGYRASSYRHIPAGGWAYGVPLDFVISLPDSAETDDILLDISHDNTYPYSNLWVEMTIGSRVDTLNIDLCDAAGHWYGRGMEGRYQLEVPVAAGVTLADSSVVTLRHIMRVDTVRGISQIGLTVKSPEL